MARILVVGATGQLGTAVVRQALDAGHHVRALVRPKSQHWHLHDNQRLEVSFGDLRNVASLETACTDIDAIISTATVVFPKGQYSFEQDEGLGYQNLLKAGTRAEVKQILFVSIAMPFTPQNLQQVPSLRMKARCEDLIREAKPRHTIFRCAPFMDDYFALIGSEIPLRGEIAATLDRSRGMTRVYRSLFGCTIEKYGTAVVPGRKTSRHAFIAVADVAAYLVAAIDHADARNATIEIGGPQCLSWQEVADIYSQLIGRRVRVLSQPPQLLQMLARVTARLSEAVSNQLALLWLLAENETALDSRTSALRFGITMTDAESYLARKVGGVSANEKGIA